MVPKQSLFSDVLMENNLEEYPTATNAVAENFDSTGKPANTTVQGTWKIPTSSTAVSSLISRKSRGLNGMIEDL